MTRLSYIPLIALSLTFVSAFLIGTPARADTDYHCLNSCVSSGHSEMSCMAQCTNSPLALDAAPRPTIGTPSPTQTPNSGRPDTTDASDPTQKFNANHRLLAPLNPIASDDAKLGVAPVSPYRESTDYRCLTQCLQTHLQYTTCQKSCTNVTLQNGTAVVKIEPKAFDPAVQAAPNLGTKLPNQ